MTMLLLFKYSIAAIKRQSGEYFLMIAIIGFAFATSVFTGKLMTDLPAFFKSQVLKSDIIIAPKASGFEVLNAYGLLNGNHLGLVDFGKIAKDPNIGIAAPIALGDNFYSNKIIWTTKHIFEALNLKLANGRIFNQEMEIVIGNNIAKAYGLEVGDKIQSNHGNSTHEAHEETYIITGIIARSGGIEDNLLFADSNSIEHVHHEKKEEHSISNLANALIVKLKSKNLAPQFIAKFNQDGSISAISPALEFAKIETQIRPIVDFLQNYAKIIIALALICAAIIALQNQKIRSYDYWLMRVLGANWLQLLVVGLIEALVISVLILLSTFGFYEFIATTFGEIKVLGLRAILSLTLIDYILIWAMAFIIATVSIALPIIKSFLIKNEKGLSQ